MISDCGLRIADCYEGGRCARFRPQPAIRNPRSGMTLVELLVVITIMAILLGAAIPVISPADDSRRLREASRAVNTFIAGAKTRAKETGRPFGVAFKKLSQDTGNADDNGVCLEMYYVEEQPPYAGFDSNARVMLGTDAVAGGATNPDQILLRFVTRGVGASPGSDLPPVGYITDPIPTGVIRPGDVIQVGDKFYEFVDTADDGNELDNSGAYVTDIGNPDNSVFVRPINCSVTDLYFVYDGAGQRILDKTQAAVPRFWTEPLRYKVLRQPTKASGEPLLMNEKTAIDLEASGFGNGVRLHDPYRIDSGRALSPNNNADNVIIMFAPEGAMNEAYVNLSVPGQGIQRMLLSSNLFLLVGLRENIPSPQTDFYGFSGTDREKQDEKSAINWLNGDARWVVVGAQTGAVATVENAFVDPEQYAFTEPDNTTRAALPTAEPARSNALTTRRTAEITVARDFARQAISQGGK